MTEPIVHAHSAGIIGGQSVCGDAGGDVSDNEKRVTCSKCIEHVTAFLTSKGWKQAKIDELFGRTTTSTAT